jgi:transcriptional repressor NrdR
VRCPFCRALDDKVVDSRAADDGESVRRRRECLHCGRRFTTYERIEDVALLVVKRSGDVVAFDRGKLAAGIERAASGRLDAAVVAELAGQVEEAVRAAGPPVASDVIGLAVLERLRALDQVAYLRFASVYKGFEDVADFERELGELAAGELQKTTAPKPRSVDTTS